MPNLSQTATAVQHGAPAAPAPDKLAAALALAKYGFDIFPLRPYRHPGPDASPEQLMAAEKDAKKPLIENWQNLATNDETRVTAWWRQYPDANIGISTQGLLVIDVDPWKGGKETFADLARSGKLTGEEFPPSLAVGTQSGGTHCFYCLPPKATAKGGVNKLGAGIDIKAHGGYVVGAGSTINGRSYAWKKGYQPNKRPLAEAPQWLIKRCNAPRPRSADAGKVIVLEDEVAIRQARQWLKSSAPRASIGERGYTAYKVACRFYDYGVTKETCIDLLIDWSEEYCEAPMDGDDIEHAAYSAHVNRDNAIGSKHPDAPGFEPYEMPARESAPTKPAPKRRGLHSVPFDEAVSNALAETTEPLIDGLIDCAAMSVWYGESNSGKTFAVLDASYHIAAGRKWLGMDTKRGAVAYVAAEGGKGIGKRLLALHLRYAADEGKAPLFVIPCPVDLLRPDADLKALIAEVEAIKQKTGLAIELIVIDTLSRALAGGNENDSQDMGRFVSNLDALRVATGAHVAVVHHTGKDKARGARGHSLLRAATDTEIEIDNKTLTVTKQRDMDGEISISFVLKPVLLGLTKTGKEITSCTVEMRAAGSPLEQLPLQPELLNFKAEIAMALLAICKNDREAVYSRPFSTRFGVDCAHKVPAVDAYEHSKDSKALRNRADRWLLELLEKGHVKKVQRGQWLLVDARNAQDAHYRESILCSDAHHPKRVSIEKDQHLATECDDHGRELAS